MKNPGILAIWNDCKSGREADFERWFQGEHLLERLAVPGFLYGRRHQAISGKSGGTSGYFNFYLTQSPDTLTSPAYRERLNHPTPLTRTIMSEVFLNMNRTVCERTLRRGSFRGAYAVTLRFEETPEMSRLDGTLEQLCIRPEVAAGEIWTAQDVSGVAPSEEERLRGGDRKIKACLMVDTLRQEDAEALGADLSRQYPKAETGVFRVLCSLGRGDL